MSRHRMCPKCGSKKSPVLCIVNVCNYADVDSEDYEYKEVSEISVDTATTLWLHVCRNPHCREIIDAGIEDEGVLKRKNP